MQEAKAKNTPLILSPILGQDKQHSVHLLFSLFRFIKYNQ